MALKSIFKRGRARLGWQGGQREFPAGDVAELRGAAGSFLAELKALKASLEPSNFTWYAHDILGSFSQLDRMLTGSHRALFDLAGDGPIADIGGADGDLSFFLAHLGREVDLIDHAPSNWNSLKGARLLEDSLGCGVQIHDIDLDQRQPLPRRHYGLAFFLGILYHLKNPLGVLEDLGTQAGHLLLSTRIADFSPQGQPMREEALAYLVDSDELNQDASNYWIFSLAGLRRLLDRAGWDILDLKCFGDLSHSTPTGGDQRVFLLARSRATAG